MEKTPRCSGCGRSLTEKIQYMEVEMVNENGESIGGRLTFCLSCTDFVPSLPGETA